MEKINLGLGPTNQHCSAIRLWKFCLIRALGFGMFGPTNLVSVNNWTPLRHTK